MKRKVMLYPCTLNWSFLTQTPQQICKQFAKNGYDVIFCNNTQSQKPCEEVEPNIFVYHNFEEVLNKIKHKQIKVDVFYYTWAKSVEYVDRVNAKVNIYNRVDEFPDWAKYEEEAINKAHIIFTTSQLIYDKTEKIKPTYLIRNACPEHYITKNSAIPKEFENIDKPIILFSGAIGSWVDTRLIKKVAEKYKTFLVGQEFGKDCPSNVHKLGVKNHDELHAYYQHANVSLIPFNTKNQITLSSNPIKLYESMATGTLTVATKWGETEIYPEVVLTATTDEEFMIQVERAIYMSINYKDYISNKAKSIASENTWEKRFIEIENAIKEFCEATGVAI